MKTLIPVDFIDICLLMLTATAQKKDAKDNQTMLK